VPAGLELEVHAAMKTDAARSAFSLVDQVAMVTGGGTGLGLAMARCFVSAGARVVLVGRRAEVLERAAAELGDAATVIPADVNDLDPLPALVARAEREAGPIDILVNNAGFHRRKPALETADDELAAMLRTHVNASFALSREAAKGMLTRGRGNVVFIGSMASVMGIPDVSTYTVAKTAVVGMTRSLAVEWSGRGVRVNAILPGWIDAGVAVKTLDQDPARKAKILSRTPMGRLGDAEDVGWAAVYFCSPAAKFVTGTTLCVDGGASIGF
jgi:gluconate 5-dehydrogenase